MYLRALPTKKKDDSCDVESAINSALAAGVRDGPNRSIP